MAEDDSSAPDIVIRAIPPKDMDEERRRRLARVIVEMLRQRGFTCELIIPDDGE